jgi:hypothetical protein
VRGKPGLGARPWAERLQHCAEKVHNRVIEADR